MSEAEVNPRLAKVSDERYREIAVAVLKKAINCSTECHPTDPWIEVSSHVGADVRRAAPAGGEPGAFVEVTVWVPERVAL